MNKATVGTSSGRLLRSGIAGSRGGSICSFLGTSILVSTVAAPVCVPSSRAQTRSSPRPRPHLLPFAFSVMAVLTGVRGSLAVVLICGPLVSEDVERFTRTCCHLCVLFGEESV